MNGSEASVERATAASSTAEVKLGQPVPVLFVGFCWFVDCACVCV
jgi:hypothetical protein